MVAAICKEIELRSSELTSPPRSIYFGGGSPSVLAPKDLAKIIKCLNHQFDLGQIQEITLESNPDDHDETRLIAWRELGINRLSIGIQSFIDRDLEWMNRAHNAEEAMACVQRARSAGFDAMSIDLIYGIPGQSLEEWTANIDQAIDMNIDHISAYCLTIEPKTALQHQLDRGEIEEKDDEQVVEEYQVLEARLQNAGFDHYEVSNFAKPGKRAIHNSMYWNGGQYLGIGPSAHSFDGTSKRSWNVANNPIYIQSLQRGAPAITSETLTHADQFNELLMTSLRTQEGIALSSISDETRQTIESQLDSLPSTLLNQLDISPSHLRIPSQHWIQSDAIIRALFLDKNS